MGSRTNSTQILPTAPDPRQLHLLESRDVGDHDVETIPICSLSVSADSPRLIDEDRQHTLRLAEIDALLPPILVHRQSMTVIDGYHRLKAATLKGHDSIPVRFFDGSQEEAYLHAVRANTTHGLPLTMQERRNAVRRIIVLYPYLSDRAIAAYVGLSDKTVGAIRRSSAANPEFNARLGADGRIRPLNGQFGRQRAADIIKERPTASLREVAEEAGISVGTAYHVRQQLRQGGNPVRGRTASCPQKAAADAGAGPSPASGPASRAPRSRADRSYAIDQHKIVGSLIKDPAVRLSERGRELLRWLHSHVVTVDCLALVDSVPPHRRSTVARIARESEQVWREFAQELERMDTAAR